VLPLGDVWGDTKVIIGSALGGTFEETFAVAPNAIAPAAEERSVRVAQLFAKFPLSVLRSNIAQRLA